MPSTTIGGWGPPADGGEQPAPISTQASNWASLALGTEDRKASLIRRIWLTHLATKDGDKKESTVSIPGTPITRGEVMERHGELLARVGNRSYPNQKGLTEDILSALDANAVRVLPNNYKDKLWAWYKSFAPGLTRWVEDAKEDLYHFVPSVEVTAPAPEFAISSPCETILKDLEEVAQCFMSGPSAKAAQSLITKLRATTDKMTERINHDDALKKKASEELHESSKSQRQVMVQLQGIMDGLGRHQSTRRVLDEAPNSYLPQEGCDLVMFPYPNVLKDLKESIARVHARMRMNNNRDWRLDDLFYQLVTALGPKFADALADDEEVLREEEHYDYEQEQPEPHVQDLISKIHGAIIVEAGDSVSTADNLYQLVTEIFGVDYGYKVAGDREKDEVEYKVRLEEYMNEEIERCEHERAEREDAEWEKAECEGDGDWEMGDRWPADPDDAFGFYNIGEKDMEAAEGSDTDTFRDDGADENDNGYPPSARGRSSPNGSGVVDR